LWPSAKHGYKDVDPSDADVKALLSRIAREHEAEIEASEVDSAVTVTVKAKNRPRAQKIIQVLRDQLLYRPDEEGVWRANPLVHPPKGGEVCFTAVLQPKEGTTGRRVTALRAGAPEPVGPTSVATTKSDFKKEFLNILDNVAGILRYTPSGMRMRVQFGTLVLDEWRKDKTEYNFADVENLVRRAGTRGTAHMLSA
jgi:hypothetical protein